MHDTVKCPVDPATLPPDAVRVDDEIVIVQDIEIKPKNTKFQRQVFYSPSQENWNRFFQCNDPGLQRSPHSHRRSRETYP